MADLWLTCGLARCDARDSRHGFLHLPTSADLMTRAWRGQFVWWRGCRDGSVVWPVGSGPRPPATLLLTSGLLIVGLMTGVLLTAGLMTSGLLTCGLLTGGLLTGGLLTGGLLTGGLLIVGLMTGVLLTGGLLTGGLLTCGLLTGGLLTGGLLTGGLLTGGLLTSGLQTSGWLTSGLLTGGLLTGGQMTSGLLTSGLLTGGLLTGGLLTGELLTGRLLISGLLTGGLLTGGLLTGELLIGGLLPTRLLTSGLLTGGLLTGGLLTSGLQTSGWLTSGLLTGGLLTGGQMTSGLLTSGLLTSEHLTSGQLDMLIGLLLTNVEGRWGQWWGWWRAPGLRTLSRRRHAGKGAPLHGRMGAVWNRRDTSPMLCRRNVFWGRGMMCRCGVCCRSCCTLCRWNAFSGVFCRWCVSRRRSVFCRCWVFCTDGWYGPHGRSLPRGACCLPVRRHQRLRSVMGGARGQDGGGGGRGRSGVGGRAAVPPRGMWLLLCARRRPRRRSGRRSFLRHRTEPPFHRRRGTVFYRWRNAGFRRPTVAEAWRVSVDLRRDVRRRFDRSRRCGQYLIGDGQWRPPRWYHLGVSVRLLTCRQRRRRDDQHGWPVGVVDRRLRRRRPLTVRVQCRRTAGRRLRRRRETQVQHRAVTLASHRPRRLGHTPGHAPGHASGHAPVSGATPLAPQQWRVEVIELGLRWRPPVQLPVRPPVHLCEPCGRVGVAARCSPVRPARPAARLPLAVRAGRTAAPVSRPVVLDRRLDRTDIPPAGLLRARWRAAPTAPTPHPPRRGGWRARRRHAPTARARLAAQDVLGLGEGELRSRPLPVGSGGGGGGRHGVPVHILGARRCQRDARCCQRDARRLRRLHAAPRRPWLACRPGRRLAALGLRRRRHLKILRRLRRRLHRRARG